MDAKEFLKSKGVDLDALEHPQDRNMTRSEINLFEIMEEYHQSKVNNVVLDNVIKCDCCDKDITNQSKLCMKCANEGFD